MTITTLRRRLEAKGLDARLITLHNVDGSGKTAPGIMVYHDYNGPYPTRETFDAHNAAVAAATRNGFRSEQRGHYSATLIWKGVDAA